MLRSLQSRRLGTPTARVKLPPRRKGSGSARLIAMPERADVRISVEPGTVEDVRKTVLSGLFGDNERFAGPMGNISLTIAARDHDGKIIGGLLVGMQPGWRWMRLVWLWV